MPLSLDDPDESGSKLYPKDILNHLLLVWVIEYIEHSPTKFTKYGDDGKPSSPCDAVIVDVVDLDQYDENGVAGLLCRKTWWRQGRLIGVLKPRVGKPNPILVRMGKGGASTGMNAPFEITTMSGDPASVARANNWYAANPNFTPSAVYVDDRPAGSQAVQEQLETPPRSMPLPPARPAETPLEEAARLSYAPGSPELQAHQRLLRMAGPQSGSDADIPF